MSTPQQTPPAGKGETLSTAEMLAIALGMYDTDCDVSDALPDDAWSRMHDLEYVETVRTYGDDAETRTTEAGRAALLASVRAMKTASPPAPSAGEAGEGRSRDRRTAAILKAAWGVVDKFGASTRDEESAAVRSLFDAFQIPEDAPIAEVEQWLKDTGIDTSRAVQRVSLALRDRLERQLEDAKSVAVKVARECDDALARLAASEQQQAAQAERIADRDREIYALKGTVGAYEKTIAAQAEELDRLRAALAFYAEASNWDGDIILKDVAAGLPTGPAADRDAGDIARAALASSSPAAEGGEPK